MKNIRLLIVTAVVLSNAMLFNVGYEPTPEQIAAFKAEMLAAGNPPAAQPPPSEPTQPTSGPVATPPVEPTPQSVPTPQTMSVFEDVLKGLEFERSEAQAKMSAANDAKNSRNWSHDDLTIALVRKFAAEARQHEHIAISQASWLRTMSPPTPDLQQRATNAGNNLMYTIRNLRNDLGYNQVYITQALSDRKGSRGLIQYAPSRTPKNGSPSAVFKVGKAADLPQALQQRLAARQAVVELTGTSLSLPDSVYAEAVTAIDDANKQFDADPDGRSVKAGAPALVRTSDFFLFYYLLLAIQQYEGGQEYKIKLLEDRANKLLTRSLSYETRLDGKSQADYLDLEDGLESIFPPITPTRGDIGKQ